MSVFDVWVSNGEEAYIISVYATDYADAENRVNRQILPHETVIGIEKIG